VVLFCFQENNSDLVDGCASFEVFYCASHFALAVPIRENSYQTSPALKEESPRPSLLRELLLHHTAPFITAQFRLGTKKDLEMKKKTLLLASIAATLLSVALLIAPANAVVTAGCTKCTATDSTGKSVTANCQVAPIDSCFCPLSGTITKNGCSFVGAAPQ
jgi:hypothetical protein